ncbi:MAG: hypothetical protein R6V76_00405 [Desulfobacterales bacterium]
MRAGYTAGAILNLFSEGLEYLEKAKKIFEGRNETNSYSYINLMMSIGIVNGHKGQQTVH